MKWLTLNALSGCLFLLLGVGAVAQPGGAGAAGSGALPAVGSGAVRVMPGINLPLDSMTSLLLIQSLEGWLGHAKDAGNPFVGAEDRVGTRLLLDELWDIEKNSSRKDTAFYQCWLTNAILQDSGQLLVQFSYIGVQDNTPLLRASYTVVARRSGDGWLFTSPLAQHTVTWKSRQIGNCLFHYKTVLNVDKAQDYEKRVAFYDQKLKAPPSTIDFYCCDDLVEAGQLIGLEYKSDYGGQAHDEYGASDAVRTVIVSGDVDTAHFNTWDPHDTWHSRLHRVLSTKVINRPVDEGSAILYGGSWRIYHWADILSLLKAYAGAHPDADWLSLYKEAANLVPPPKIVKISYAINALMIQRLDKEGRWPAVIELLSCGPKEPGDANYFAAVKKITGIDTAGFNAYVWGLVRD